MNRRLIAAFVAIVVTSVPSLALGQAKPETSAIVTEPVVVDLAAPSPRTIRVEAGTYRLDLINAVPGRRYWLHVGPSQAQEISPLSSDDAPNREFAPQFTMDVKQCPVVTIAHKLIAATTEQEVRSSSEALRVQLGQSESSCSDENKFAEDVLAATSISLVTPVTLSANALRTLEVASQQGSRWEVQLTSMGSGVWQTTYGFVVSPNRDEDFFSEATGQSDFTVRRKPRDEGSLTFLPSVLFTWLPSAQAFSTVQHGPTVGLGITTGDAGGRVSALVGWGIRFHQNIGLAAGVNVYQHRRLDGQYLDGQVIEENLESDQLNRDSTRANYFVALTLRFGAHPFGRSSPGKAANTHNAQRRFAPGSFD
ncbi:MAG: hypothetical protein M3468_08930 [Acidobacteriota bacterium]|nr:hypothetical protein [Acidobacteriota bacterium]